MAAGSPEVAELTRRYEEELAKVENFFREREDQVKRKADQLQQQVRTPPDGAWPNGPGNAQSPRTPA